MKKQLTWMGAVALAAVLASPLAVASQAAFAGANAARTSSSVFAIADVNHDGMLARSEIPPAWADLRAHFAAQDLDHNLRLDQQEFDIYLLVAMSKSWGRPGGSGVPQFAVAYHRASPEPVDPLPGH